jgi:RNA polymerase sigma-70 factor (ECF subfamily)
LCSAWEQFYSLYDPVIRRLTQACKVPKAELDDCSQEVWAAVLTHLRDFRYDPARGKFLTWLYTLVHTKAADQIRRQNRHPARRLTRTAEDKLYSHESDPAAEYLRHRQKELLHGALAELQREVSAAAYLVLCLRRVQGLTLADTASFLGLSLDQVRLRERRTWLRLCALLKPYADIDFHN